MSVQIKMDLLLRASSFFYIFSVCKGEQLKFKQSLGNDPYEFISHSGQT